MTQAHILKDPLDIVDNDLLDWGDVAHPIGEPVSKQRGLLLFRREDKSSEMGMWQCTAGSWRCDVEKDEFCYFLSGKAVYTADDGTVTEVQAGYAGAFPAGWAGVCEVIETVRKVYMVQ